MRIIMSSPHTEPIRFKIFVVVMILFAGVGVGLSDGASVQIPVRVSDAERIVISEEESIESLVSSKILMDRTSSLPGSLSLSLPPSPPSPPSPSAMLKVTGISQSSKLLKPSSKSIAAVVSTPTKTGSEQRGGDDVKEEDVVSPLHVAQCRATCLEKFALHDGVTKSGASSANVNLKNKPGNNKMDEDSRLLPNILRLKRKKRAASTSPSGSASCFHNSPECLSCWKNCQLLEVRSSSPPIPSETGSEGKNPEAEFPSLKRTSQNKTEKIEGKEETSTTSQHPILACSTSTSTKPCMAGCQVACSFYERLLTKAGEQRDAVVATKHESVVNIVPGKITWPDAAAVSSSALSAAGPVVYVVIQVYPNRKWRQIAQTTEQELSIPTELTGAMKTKLRSIRVLVVGPQGLRSIYSPLDSATPQQQQQQRQQRQFSFSAKKNDKFGKMGEERETSSSTASTSTAEAITTETNDYDINNNSHVEMGAGERDASTNEAPELETERESGTLPTAEATSTTTASSPSVGGITSVQKPFEIRLVSLIHQKSLVIAELRWDDVGGNPSQEYLITWELTGGGLKGHLVTDSTSVTLSLWPDTTYQIQVEEFQQNLDSDGEQPTPVNSDSAVKSFPLIVDTSIASFPMERPSALLSDKTDELDGEEEYQQDEQDEFSEEDEKNGEDEEIEEDEPLGHKSIGKVLLVSFISLVLVLGILTLVAFTWIKLRMLSCEKSSCGKVECGSENGGGGGSCAGASDCLSICFGGCGCDGDPEKDPNLLVSQEDLYLDTREDECANCSSSLASSSFYPSPMHYVASLKKSKRKGCFKQFSQQTNKMTGQQELPVAVAVISSASTSSSSCTGAAGEISGPAPVHSVFNCYNVYSNSSSLACSSPDVAPELESSSRNQIN